MDTEIIMAIITAAVAVSEVLSMIPGIRSNGIFQLIFDILKYLAKRPKD